MVGADAEILKSSFHRCTSAAWGGAVWAAELARYPFTGLQASVVVSESDFTNNSAVFGGAMAVSAKAVTQVDSSRFHGNEATTGGAASVKSEASFTVIASHFTSNRAGDSGGVYIYV